MKKAIIFLEDGFSLEGDLFGTPGEKIGELVFNTSMSGYQEILTDPSYKGQIVIMTYPLIGNYGISMEDSQSLRPQAEGVVVREYSKTYSNWRAERSLGGYLKEYRVTGVSGIDTRALTRHIRIQGAMKAIISTEDFDQKSLMKKVKAAPDIVGRNLVKDVTCNSVYDFTDGNDSKDKRIKTGDKRYRVVVMDFGVKHSILVLLKENNCSVTVVPAQTRAEDILSLNPDGIVLSNGPGDPAPLLEIVAEIRKLIGKKPLFGICLGHQLLGLAMGGKTFKLKFGHHGGNHPVKEMNRGKIIITCQNHGFCIDRDSLKSEDVEVTHINLNDGTLEGIKHKRYPLFSVQFHPEAGPGPHEGQYLFKRFTELMNHA